MDRRRPGRPSPPPPARATPPPLLQAAPARSLAPRPGSPPGAADLEALALQGSDGIVRPLLASPPPLPAMLAPGSRALAVGASFDPALYPAMPAGTPVLRASTQRLLGRGLSDDAPPPFRLVTSGAVPVELTEFPGSDRHCLAGASLQRDEAPPPDAPATWSCGPVGGTPGR